MKPENRGGDRVPSNPAPVSNPGAGSARTDGQAARFAAGIDNAEDFYEMQTQAKLNKSGVTLPTGRSGGAPVMQPEVVGLNEFTQRPDEPVSAGADSGAGPDSSVLASTTMLSAMNDADLAKLASHLPVYARIAESPNASAAFKNWYRWLRTQV